MKVRTGVLVLLLLTLSLAACGAQPQLAQASQATREPFLMAGGVFLSGPQDFLLPSELTGEAYALTSAGTEAPNSRVIEMRPDGEAYIAATGRLMGWQRQLDRRSGAGPLYLVNVVNVYESEAGPLAVLSREWHAEVWNRLDMGELTLRPDLPGVDAEHLVWQDGSGGIGVEIAYHNLYLLLTGPGEDGVDQYAFFADLVPRYLQWIREGETQ
ncbi:MAG: hypothetical protein KF821_09605 [Anaerolineales bacterium]|nr:hypothetical protein [Anaerolineales bacterium]MBX3006064.1 hypothetical protein [Anaerolineales bacterium]MCW5838584.1 hypothetical protein [Anaerolineales bacterium]